MRRRPGFVLGWTLCVLIAGAASAMADITVRATVNAQQARVGEAITLTIAVEGAQNVPAPQVRVSGLEARYVGPSTQVSIVNGRMNSSVQHRYSLLALQAGRFEIGPITINYDGKDYSTQPIGIEFVGANPAPPPQAGAANQAAPGNQAAAPAAAQGRALFAVLSTPRNEVYLHERIAIDIDLYIGPVRAGDLQFPTLATDGISIEAFPQPTQRQQVVDGQNYQVVHFHTTAAALRSGELTLGPATLHLTVYERDRRGRGNDPFFDNFFQQGRATDLRTEPLTLSVLPLPDAGKPNEFSGAVGSFTMQVQAAPTELTAGDPITVKLNVVGDGNLSDASPPQLTRSEGFRTYGARVLKSEGNSREFEQVIIPNEASLSQLPPFRFSYFDPQTKRYNVLESEPIAIKVSAPQQAPRTDIVSADAAPRRIGAEEKLGRDIVFIKDDPGELTARDGGATTLWLLLAWLPMPPLLFGLASWYERRRRRLSGDERYARFTRAGKDARRGLAAAEQALQQGDRGQFYEDVSRTMREYLAAKLDLPVGGVDADAAASRGVAADGVEQLRRFFATCEQARFAPTAGTDDMRSTLHTAQEVLKRLERERRSARFGGLTAILVATLLIAGMVIAEEVAPSSPQTTFFHANGMYKEGNYSDAVNEYEQLVRAGLKSPELYFNLGNAWFKAGERGKAILYYQRALRLHPSDPDVEANLAYAQSLNSVEPCIPPLWQKFAFPLHGRASSQTLLTIAITAYTLLFLLLAAQRLLPQLPRWFSYVAIVLGVATAVVGTSGLQQAYVDDWQTHAVITAEGDTSARFEPAENGTPHFTLKQGAMVRILEKRDGWMQVSRCDGRRGWVPRLAAAPL